MTSVPAIPHWLTLKNLKSTTLKSTESLPETCTRFEYLALCKAIIIMAHKLGIKVIAEGVENQSQHDLLWQQAATMPQGYLYSPAGASLRVRKAVQNPPSRVNIQALSAAAISTPAVMASLCITGRHYFYP